MRGEPAYENRRRHFPPVCTFLNNPDIGGRYSTLSLTGIVPAALIGIDVETLLQNVSSNPETLMSVGASLGATLGMLATKGRDKLTDVLPPRWKSYGGWLEQLIAESTSKEGRAFCSAGMRRFRTLGIWEGPGFVLFQNKNEARASAFESLAGAGHPVITVKIHDDYDLSAQMFIWEMATTVAARVMGVNPFRSTGCGSHQKTYPRRDCRSGKVQRRGG